MSIVSRNQFVNIMNSKTGQQPERRAKAEANNLRSLYGPGDVVRFISILLFYLTTGLFSYIFVRSMDALNVVNEIQYILMIVLGVAVGLVGFFIFKKLFVRVR